MINLLKIILGRKLPQKKLKEIMGKRDFTETLDDLGKHKIAYLLTSNGIIITEETTKSLQHGNKIESKMETKKYTLNGFLSSYETIRWSGAPGDLFPKLKTHETTTYEPPGRFKGKTSGLGIN